jgi:glycosyltransferase involved in cell wall biosynthesis
MKVLHFILGKANKDRANGVNQVIAGLAKYSVRHGAEVRVIGKAQSVEREGERIARDGFGVEAYSQWSGPLRKAMIDAIGWADIVHLHGAYAPWNLWVAGLCKRRGKPFVITLHDGLAPKRAMTKNRIRKQLFHVLLQKRHLRAAAGIHLLTEEEATDLFNCADSKNVFCIPNGIDLDDFPEDQMPTMRISANITIGYLGRLSPEKNLDALCAAFIAMNIGRNLRLKLAGPESNYGRHLIANYGAQGVEWVGPKFGTDKNAFIRSVNLFVHPSLCDVFSIAAMEVLALRTPLLITRTSKASYFYNNRAFFMCEPTAFGIERGLRSALKQQSKWPGMVNCGRELVEQRLNWSMTVQELLPEYKKILNAGKT